jgi:hypothetical protein
MSALPQSEPSDSVTREILEELRQQLAHVRAEIAELHKNHARALILQRVYEGDPVTRERFAFLHAHIQEFPGRMASLREDERLLQRWVARAQVLVGD